MKCANDTGIQALEVEHDDVAIQTGQRIKHMTARAMHDGFLIDYRRDKPRSVQFRQVNSILCQMLLHLLNYQIFYGNEIETDFYNFDLEQWSFKRNSKESWSSYLYRMRNHNSWKTKNISSWDLSLSGAEELNSFLQISSDIYYFSIITSTTMKKENSDFHIPVKGTSIITRTRSKIIGSRNGYWPDGNMTTSEWYENDGVVNSISMKAPVSKSNGSDASSKYDPNDLLITGQWYWMKIPGMDHWNIIGHLANKERKEKSKSFFISHLNRLSDLPSR